MLRRLSWSPMLILLACATRPSGAADGNLLAGAASRAASMPRDGQALLHAMHARYAASWFHTLTFIQRTTTRRPDGSEQVSTWYEAQSGPRLRIDVGNPSDGNGVLYTPDSAYIVRGGKLQRAAAEGNPFLPLIAGVFIQPVELTMRQLQRFNVDWSRIRLAEWEGRPTYVVGAASAADSTSPQVWVDQERLIVTRFRLRLVPSPSGQTQDIRLENNVPVGGGWLATRVRILDGGMAMQTEDYSEWRPNVSLPAGFFEAEHWLEFPHWSQRNGSQE